MAAAYFSGENETMGFGVYGAVIRSEPETGALHVEPLVAVDDCGVVVTPMLLEG